MIRGSAYLLSSVEVLWNIAGELYAIMWKLTGHLSELSTVDVLLRFHLDLPPHSSKLLLSIFNQSNIIVETPPFNVYKEKYREILVCQKQLREGGVRMI